MAKDTSGRRLQSYISKTNTQYSRGYRISRLPEFPLVGSMNDAVHAAIARFGQLLVRSSGRFLSQLVSERRYL
jgi:hypothetical protein